MLQKLACLAVVAGGLQSGVALAQFAPVRGDDGLPRSGGFELSHPDVVPSAMPMRSLTQAAGLTEEPFGLSDSERFQLRQQIRDAAQDIYAAPSRTSSLASDRSPEIRR